MRSFGLLLCAALLTACNASKPPAQDSTGADAAPYSMLSAARTLPVGDSTCPNGGSAIEVGFDNDSDGILDSEEIDKTYPVCHGLNGIDGADGADGAPGADGADAGPYIMQFASLSENLTFVSSGCQFGGVQIAHGADLSGDGKLNDEASAQLQVRNLCNQFNNVEQSRTCTVYAKLTDSNTPDSPALYGITYRLDELSNAEIDVYGAVLSEGFEISKSTHWSPFLDKQVSNWQSAKVVVYLDVLGSPNGGHWLLSIDRGADGNAVRLPSTTSATLDFSYIDSDLMAPYSVSIGTFEPGTSNFIPYDPNTKTLTDICSFDSLQ